MKKRIVFLLTVSLAFFLVACGDKDNNGNAKDNNNDGNKSEGIVSEEDATAPEEITLKDDEKVGEEDVVVKINDAEITGDEYNYTYLQAKFFLSQNGYDPEDAEQAKEITLDSIIEQELMRQEGEKEGFDVTEEEVEAEFNLAQEESEDQLLPFLEKHGISEATYKKILSTSMVREQYLDSIITEEDITDEEIEEAYEMLKENDSEIPELNDIKDQLKEMLASQNQQEQIKSKIEELVEAAEIEELI